MSDDTGTGRMPLRLVIHAPTPAALERARNNARNLLKARPDAEVRIVVNAGAVAAALDTPDGDTDGLLRVCGNTLGRLGRSAGGLTVVAAGVLDIAEAQAAGWGYMRA
ncbi:DsrE family protein [Azospirillum picis]|uniref:NitT/TauT family transport system ATP-binding protein n=1 Tax=Azospirillum picis TaxID=488438 RepID=A0ABU0MNY1_9PROT|nr:hypothetical protein [Azospirillum picis]MBP2301351.1 NitT/TauT family transport system ATP-binding protein [Azospirillum picis]MDQ0535182.1 NitT/TauT family transport system ATP-binding protein [Azospirillum picis]